jgi:hypothetical protein
MQAQRPRAGGVRAGALASSWPVARARSLWRLPRGATTTKMPHQQQRDDSASSGARGPTVRIAALPAGADAEGAPQLEAYTTDRTPDSQPTLVTAADVDSHRSLR